MEGAGRKTWTHRSAKCGSAEKILAWIMFVLTVYYKTSKISKCFFYQHTKFGAAVTIRSRDIPLNRNSKWRPLTAHFYFRFHFWPWSRLWDPQRIYVPNFIEIGQRAAVLLQYKYFQDGRRPPSWILLQVDFDRTGASGTQISICTPNLVQLWPRRDIVDNCRWQ